MLCDHLFTIVVLKPIGRGDFDLAKTWERIDAVIPFLKVVPKSEYGVLILINRTQPEGGAWDDPVDRVKPAEVDLRFAHFFDWDELGWKDFELCRVGIAGFSSQTHVVGRFALIAFQHVEVMFDSSVS